MTEHISFNQLKWEGDHVKVFIPQHKSDPKGENKEEPRHMYTNPLNPIICPIHALVSYLLLFPEIARIKTTWAIQQIVSWFVSKAQGYLSSAWRRSNLTWNPLHPKRSGNILLNRNQSWTTRCFCMQILVNLHIINLRGTSTVLLGMAVCYHRSPLEGHLRI